jgi:hypothetical protein
MAVRVLRLMEYVYEDLEAAHRDMEHWQVQGTYHPGGMRRISSTVLLNPTPYEEPTLVGEVLNDDSTSTGFFHEDLG